MVQFNNLKDNQQKIDFITAVKTGLGRNQGLFFPDKIPSLNNINTLLALPTIARNTQILKAFVNPEVSTQALSSIIENTFTFPSPIKQINANTHCLELFHGPTLAFKDFGATFMANCLQQFGTKQPLTILTATSGDTGAAVARAFYQSPNIQVVILYPQGKISQLQQKMFTTLGKNITCLAINGSFDDCQALVKQCFNQPSLVAELGLNSANSINISRLLAQVCYYFEAFSQLTEAQRNQVVVSVPSGNFGNLCAGIIAKVLGLPIKRFIAATNLNDTVPRYLQNQEWSPQQTIATLSNAMDVSNPNNWPRIEYLIQSDQFKLSELTGIAVNEQQTKQSMQGLAKQGYVSEPHAAVAHYALQQSLRDGETGLFLGTAHPAKFKQSVESVLNTEIDMPAAILQCEKKKDLSKHLNADFELLSDFLRNGLE
ncbi:threonine synthase [Aliikangiella sp. IMCC44653]